MSDQTKFEAAHATANTKGRRRSHVDGPSIVCRFKLLACVASRCFVRFLSRRRRMSESGQRQLRGRGMGGP
jgi:hypothetical protein